MADLDLKLFDGIFPTETLKKPSGTQKKQPRAEAKENHDHPACEAAPKHKHEKAYVTSSAGGEITEGCPEHYFDRIVALDDEDTENRDKETAKLAEYIVMGEILLNPRFKGGNYRRF